MKLLHSIQDIVVAVATISSLTSSSQLHNRIQPHGYYKVLLKMMLSMKLPLFLQIQMMIHQNYWYKMPLEQWQLGDGIIFEECFR